MWLIFFVIFPLIRHLLDYLRISSAWILMMCRSLLIEKQRWPYSSNSDHSIRLDSQYVGHFIVVIILSKYLRKQANTVGRLSITVAQAKLVKNYGLTRMDPYVRIRVGHYIYETQTDPNGGKTPRWNRVFHTQLPSGVNKIFIEIYDECNFTMDELIAWTEVRIPDVVLERGETHEDWWVARISCRQMQETKKFLLGIHLVAKQANRRREWSTLF